MSGNNPLENKTEPPAKTADNATALAGPAAPPAASTNASWWTRRSRWGFAAAGTALAIAGGWYGYKYITADPGRAAAQTESKAQAQAKPDVTERPTLPERPTTGPTLDTEPPAIKPPATNKHDTLPPIPDIDLLRPPAKPAASSNSDTEPPLIVVPPIRPASATDTKTPAIDPDLFKAPDPLPTSLTDRKDKPATPAGVPILRIGGTDPMPPAPPKIVDPPAIPKIDAPPAIVDVPPVVAPPTSPMPPKMSDPPATPKSDPPPPPVVDVPPIVAPPIAPKTGDLSPIPRIDPAGVGPAPKMVDPPVPMIDPPAIGSPAIPVTPPIGAKPEKRDMYDEDWHSQRAGDTFTLISKEYYKTPDFAAALEAYNKDRRKPGEQFIRVPPTWVLEEQFPNLVGPKGDKPTAPEPNAAGNVKFEPADPTTPARRPTPPLISGTNDEYRVKAEAGETIREIARKVYGNPDSWKKLWDLNPSLDPTQPIPSGTTLRVGR